MQNPHYNPAIVIDKQENNTLSPVCSFSDKDH